MNEGQPGRRNELINMIGDATGLTIPVLYATFDTGADLASTPGATVRVKVDFTAEERTTYNVLAETKTGSDSNDNGSGSAGLLETAIQMAKVKAQKHRALRLVGRRGVGPAGRGALSHQPE